MIEYYPWSLKVLDESINLYIKNTYPILDIELGGACNYNCIYCDSPQRNAVFKTPLYAIEYLLASKRIKWLFICGLGEPSAKKNIDQLKELLLMCEKYGAKCSMFSNIANLNHEIIRFIEKGILYIIFKFDSTDLRTISEIYGIKKAENQLQNISTLFKLVRSDGHHTNIAASIVPTRHNIDEISNLVKICLEKKVFPLIGELENSGKACGIYDDIKLDQVELDNLKINVEQILNEEYTIPICPAVIAGIHVDFDGDVVVDKKTGLSCNWFWLQEPDLESIYNLNDGDQSIERLCTKIDSVRFERIQNTKEIFDSIEDDIFGGCGGNSRKLIKLYLTAQSQKIR